MPPKRCFPPLKSSFRMNIRRLLKYTLLAAVLASGSGIRAEIPDADPDQLELMGRDAIRRNAWDEADSFLTQALRLAEIADEPRKIAQNAYHLAMCRAARGEWDAALKLLDTARDEWARSKGPIDTARILEARILRRTGNTDRARAIARGLLDGDSRDVSPRIEIQALLILSKLDCERGDVNNASERLKQAGKKMKDDFPLVLKARLDEAAARSPCSGKNPDGRRECSIRRRIFSAKAAATFPWPECCSRREKPSRKRESPGRRHSVTFVRRAACSPLKNPAKPTFPFGKPCGFESTWTKSGAGRSKRFTKRGLPIPETNPRAPYCCSTLSAMCTMPKEKRAGTLWK
jgi:hypothetical protein